MFALNDLLRYSGAAWRVLLHVTKPNRNEPLEGIVMAVSSLPENWRKIQGFPDYSVSDRGRVRRDTPGRGTRAGYILKPSRDANGYACVNLSRGGPQRKQYVHRIVALAFIGPPPSARHHVAHWDGNGMNASAQNLRWATQPENEADKVRHGRRPDQAKGSRTMTHEQLDVAKRMIGRGHSKRQASIKLGVTWPVLDRALKNGIAPS